MFVSKEYAQDRIGTKLSQMSPTETALINPATIVNQKPFFDANILGFGI